MAKPGSTYAIGVDEDGHPRSFFFDAVKCPPQWRTCHACRHYTPDDGEPCVDCNARKREES